MDTAADFDFFEDRYPKRIRKPINKPEAIDELEDEIFFQKQKLMSHCVYDIQEIVASEEFKDDLVVKMSDASGFNIDYIKKHGLSTPILFNVPATDLGMIVPDADSFTVFDVLELAGKDRKIEVVEVNEQKGRTMKLADFVKYYTCSPEFRRELLNVLSLEFSDTNLAKHVKPPSFVKEIDWIDNVWPAELFERQKIHMKTNQFSDFSTYPKVQRYCLMSVANCFTDFHIDFGGTSVWYHVLKGRKIFWLIEPTEENILLYEEWIMGGNNSESFFGRIVNKCNRVELTPGMTFIIPSGWIHCVFTPEDSLVFGGNFLHSHAISMQIRVVKSEDKIRVGSKYRFPHFKQMIWYVIEHIVRKATGRIYLKPIKPKAYLADLQHFNVQVDLLDGEDEDTADDQEPCCSSAVEAGCKKAADTGYTGMGMEDSESDNEEESSLAEQNDPNICYDDMPNGSDNCYMLVPTQMKFSAKNNDKFMPVISYNEEFISSIPSTEINGYFALLEYSKKLLKTRKPDVGEGITRPKHLLLELEHFINHLSRVGRCDLNLTYDLCGPANRVVNFEQTKELVVSLRVHETVSATFSESSKKRNKRKLVKSNDSKKALKTGKQAKRAVDAPPILVDGLPHPLQSNDPPLPNPYGFNPLEAVVALGQKPLPSAYRKTVNMAQLPPVQRFRLRKKDEMNESVTSEKSEEALNISQSNSSASVNNNVSKREEKQMKMQSQQPPSSADRDLAYKSPLQRLQDEKQRKLDEQKQRNAQEERQRRFYEERQRRIEEERRRRIEDEKRAAELEKHRTAEIPTSAEVITLSDEGVSIVAQTSLKSSFGNSRFTENGNSSFSNRDYNRANNSCSSDSKFQRTDDSDGKTVNYNKFSGRGGYHNDFRGRNDHRDHSKPFYGGRNGSRTDNEGRPSGGYGRGRFEGRGRGDYRGNGGNRYNKNYNDNGYKNNGDRQYGPGRWGNSNRGYNHGSHAPSSYHHPPPYPPLFPPMMAAQPIPSNEMLSQWGLPPIPDAFRQYGMPPYGMPLPGFPPFPLIPTTSAQTQPPQAPKPEHISGHYYNQNSKPVGSTSYPQPPIMNNARYSAPVSTEHEAMEEDDAPPSDTPANNSRLDPRLRSNAEEHPSNANSRSVGSSVANSSPQSRAMDGIEGINEIGRLTKMMSNEESEDVDLRDPTFFSKTDRHQPQQQPIPPAGFNNDPNTSTGDPSMDIDNIYRLTQMYTP